MNSEPQYFPEARSWALDVGQAESRSRRNAWVVAACACLVALVEGLAILAMLPLKRTEPVMLLVDRTTGFVQRIDPARGGAIRADEALLQSLLSQYVVAREGFDRATVKSAFRKAALWSQGPARAAYLASMPASNPASPFNIYRSGDSLSVSVKSVSRIAADTALVRFDTILAGRDGRSETTGSWISVLKFRFSDAPMSFEDRLINPLGLQVYFYRRDPERPQAAAAAPVSLSPDGPGPGQGQP